MSGPRKPPQARDRMLGMHLRHYRTQRGLTIENVAHEAQVSMATVSRTESGKRHVTPEDIAVLLTLYRVAPEQRNELVAAARGGYRPTWWIERVPGWDPDILPHCTASARSITEFALNTIPAALQTRRYGLAHLHACGTTDTDGAWAARESLRQDRALLDQTYYIHEAALRTPYGGPDALREQLHHLRAAPDHGIGIRLIRSTTPVGWLNHSWTMFEYSDSPPVIYVELQHGGLFVHEPAIAGYLGGIDQLREIACSSRQTTTYLTELARRL
jgi:DNA-binding XRE family transcriptional regulator